MFDPDAINWLQKVARKNGDYMLGFHAKLLLAEIKRVDAEQRAAVIASIKHDREWRNG